MFHEPKSAIGVISDLSRELVTDTNMVQTAHYACKGCVDVFSATLAGVLISHHGNDLRVIASSEENNMALDLLESQRQHVSVATLINTVDSYVVLDLDTDSSDSLFTHMARDNGFRTALSVPLTLRSTRVGVLSVLWSSKQSVSNQDVTTLQAFANLTSASLIAEQTEIDERSLVILLERTYQNRIRLEQAKGMVAAARDCTLEEAFRIMGDFSLNTNTNLALLAQKIIQREVPTTLA
jgi:transcriptional regulator with GAF, ATPase, and Fis domain